MKPKEITIRVERDEWHRLDDKRHASRESWQSIGLKLFREWLSGESAGVGKLDSGTKTKNSQVGELTGANQRDYSTDPFVLEPGTPLAKLLERYGSRAVEELASAVLRMPEVSLANRPEATSRRARHPDEAEDHPEMGRDLSRKRRAG